MARRQIIEERPPTMKLARYIQTEMEQLLDDWEGAALKIAPQLEGEDSRALRDHARSMLEFIVQDLSTPQTAQEATRKALGKADAGPSAAAEEHGRSRLEQGLSLLQAVQELRALRERVTRLWGEKEQGLTAQDLDELVRFNETIDQLIANSVASYSDHKEHQTRLFEAMLKVSPDPSAIFDPEGRLLFLNTPMAALISAPARDAIGKTALELGLDVGAELHEAIAETVATGHSRRREFHCRLPSGRERYYDCQLLPVLDGGNEVEAVAKTSRDITEQKQAEYQAWRNANFDLLTGVPNRRLFLDRLEQTLLEAERMDISFALLFLDLDRFKQANDQLGHKAGDQLLQQVAQRINSNVRAMDTVARLGGDEFTLILKDTGRKDAKKTARALLASLEQPFEVESHRVHISATVGLTLFPEDGRDAWQLMHNADQAMYVAKEQGGQQVQVYRSWMAQSESEHMRLNRELDDAISENQLEVYYQPIIDLRTGTVSRAEALLRWNHPEEGLLPPAAFLAVAEQSRVADSINAYVLEQAVSCSQRWRNQEGEAFPININESPASFFTRTLVDQWQARLTESDFAESHITMELTPASLTNIRNAGFNPAKSFGLAGLRLHLAVDDFGIQPFSLQALQEFRVGSIKVDRELIRKAGQDGETDRLLKTIIEMAHTMDVQVVAEGVETEEQLQFLSRAGCDYAQGFLFSEALRQDDFEALLGRDTR